MQRFVVTLVAGLALVALAGTASAQYGSCNSGGCGANCAPSCNTGCGSCCLKPNCLSGLCCDPCGGMKYSFWARVNSAAPTTDCDEARWQKFWCDYYRALGQYYKRLDRMDWVIYYKFHGYQTGGGQCAPMGPGGQCGSSCGYYQAKPQYAPVFVSPQMNWGVAGSSCGQQGVQPAGWQATWPSGR